jgi:6-phosphogluconolactonase
LPDRLKIVYSVAPDAAALAARAAKYFAEKSAAAAAANGRARIAISGGSTPKAAFGLLADPARQWREKMPWDKLDLWWVDERAVPPDNQDSNYRMTREAMLDKVPLKPEQVFRIQGELPPEEAAARYESVLRNQFKLEGAEVPRFDVLALGMGDDGHTASIFPHTAGIHELARLVYANQVPQKDTWRVTLTWPVIVEAGEVFFLIGGKDKADPLHRVLQGPYDPETLPSQLIQPKNGKLLLLLDKDAAALLPPPDASGVGRLEIAR